MHKHTTPKIFGHATPSWPQRGGARVALALNPAGPVPSLDSPPSAPFSPARVATRSDMQSTPHVPGLPKSRRSFPNLQLPIISFVNLSQFL
jgi:hypothetical protein